jgi:hypothetical protein
VPGGKICGFAGLGGETIIVQNAADGIFFQLVLKMYV